MSCVWPQGSMLLAVVRSDIYLRWHRSDMHEFGMPTKTNRFTLRVTEMAELRMTLSYPTAGGVLKGFHMAVSKGEMWIRTSPTYEEWRRLPPLFRVHGFRLPWPIARTSGGFTETVPFPGMLTWYK